MSEASNVAPTKARWNPFHGFLLVAQPLILNAIGAPALAYIIRIQGEVNYAYWSVGASLISLLTVLTHMGMRPLFIRAVAQDPGNASAQLQVQMGLRMLLSAGAGSVALLLCFILRYPPVVLACTGVFGLGMILTGMADCCADVLQGLQKLASFAFVSFVAGCALTAASVVVCWAGYGPVALAVSYVTGPATNLLLLGYFAHRAGFRPVPTFSWSRQRALLKESRLLMKSGILAAAHDRMEELLLPKLVGFAEFGFFSGGLLPASRLAIVPSSVTGSFYPVLSRNLAIDPEGTRVDVVRLFTVMMVACLPAALGVTFLAPWVSTILFPASPAKCEMVMTITIWSLPAMALGWSMACCLQAAGRYDLTAPASMRSSLVMIVFTPPFVYAFGLLGACISWVVKPVVGAIFVVPAFISVFRPVIAKLPFLRVAAAGLGMQIVFSAVRAAHPPLVIELFGGGLVGSIVFFAILFATRVVTVAELKAIAQVRRG